jgi:NADH-quinone oxidoreductase subunit N
MNSLSQFAPIIILALGSLIYLVGGRAIDTLQRSFLLAIALLGVALWSTVSGAPNHQEAYGVFVDPSARLLGALVLLVSIISITTTSGALREEGITTFREYYYLILSSVIGALMMVFAVDLLIFFIGLEISSLALYCLAAARITTRGSSEAAVKYFLLGCFSSAFLLFGLALWYGATGSLRFTPPEGIILGESAIFSLSFLMILVGFAFKIGLAPFHFWVPDVYQGAPTSVTTFMSCLVKVAAVASLIRIMQSAFGFFAPWIVSSLWVLSVVAMTVGNLGALRQRSVKRMLAYSSVSQGGYLVMGILAARGMGFGLEATYFYLIAYCAMTIGAFGVLATLGANVDDLDDLKGLVRRSPFLAVSMSLFFLALAGLPPSVAGLIGKGYLLTAVLAEQYYGLAVIAAINTVIGCAYYFKVPVVVFSGADTTRSSSAPEYDRVNLGLGAYIGLSVCVLAVIVLGIYPEPILDIVKLMRR